MKFFRKKNEELALEQQVASAARSIAEAKHEEALAKLADAEDTAIVLRLINTRNHFSESLNHAFQKEYPV